jgi:hypothetical protein
MLIGLPVMHINTDATAIKPSAMWSEDMIRGIERIAVFEKLC